MSPRASLSAGRAGARGWLADIYGSRQYAFLFYTLLLTLGVAPLLSALGFSRDLLQIFLAFNLVIALLDVPGQAWRLLLILLAAVAVALRALPVSAVGEPLATGALVAGAALALVAAIAVMRFALSTRVVDAEHIYAALSAYLLAGLVFGVLHWAIAMGWPGSFVEAGTVASTSGFSLTTAIYYSFVTLATLGYGDVVPRSDVARGVAVLEAVGGQLYVAVTIARLVGAGVDHPEPPR